MCDRCAKQQRAVAARDGDARPGRARPAGVSARRPRETSGRASSLSSPRALARHAPAFCFASPQLADEQGKVVVRGFRQMPGGAPNPGQSAGVQFGDLLDAVQGERLGSFQEAVGRRRALGRGHASLIRCCREMRPPRARCRAEPAAPVCGGARSENARRAQAAWPVAGARPRGACAGIQSAPVKSQQPPAARGRAARQMSRLPATEPAGA